MIRGRDEDRIDIGAIEHRAEVLHRGQRAAVALQVLLAVDPENASGYRRLITAYLTANDLTVRAWPVSGRWGR